MNTIGAPSWIAKNRIDNYQRIIRKLLNKEILEQKDLEFLKKEKIIN